MKATILTLLGFLLLAAPTAVQAQYAYSTNADGSIYTYSTNADGSANIAGYSGPPWTVTIPTNISGLTVTSIGSSAFTNLTSLTSVTIPGSITSIGSEAFFECFFLTNVTIPASVTSIGENAFADCTHLAELTVDSQNSFYSGVNGVLFDKDQTMLIEYPNGVGRTYTIPGNVISIADSAFNYCAGLTTVTIPESVTNVGQNAFANCVRLTGLTVDSQNSFYSSVSGVLFDKGQTTLVEYPNGVGTTYAIPSSVTGIGNSAFSYCTRLTGVTIPSSVTAIEDDAFSYCTSLTSVTIPGSVTSIGDEAFACCTGLTGVTIANGVTSIGDDTFWLCTSLTDVTIASSVTSIGDEAFGLCTSLTTITIPGSVINIGSFAFDSCYSLTSVIFTGNAPSSGQTAFNSDTNATVYYLPCTAGWSTTFAGLPAVALTTQEQFSYATNAGTITITAYIGPGGAVRIPATINDLPVASIQNFAFYHQTSLTSVTIPASVTSIGGGAFDGCSSLISITIPNNVTSIGPNAFDSCYDLTSISIPSSVTSIGEDAFANAGLTNITIANGISSIGAYAFQVCRALTSVIIPSSVTSIGAEAFDACPNLTSVFFTGNAPTVGSAPFGADNATVYYLYGTTGWGVFSSNTGIPAMLWNPLIQANAANFGVQNNQFGFNITGPPDIQIVVEACTNLASPVWTPLQTNTLTNGSLYFSDPQWSNFPGRYYRISSP